MPRNRARRVDATAYWGGASLLRRLKNTVPSLPTIGRPPPDFSFVRTTGFSVPLSAFGAPPDTSSVRTNVAALLRLGVSFPDRTYADFCGFPRLSRRVRAPPGFIAAPRWSFSGRSFDGGLVAQRQVDVGQHALVALARQAPGTTDGEPVDRQRLPVFERPVRLAVQRHAHGAGRGELEAGVDRGDLTSRHVREQVRGDGEHQFVAVAADELGPLVRKLACDVEVAVRPVRLEHSARGRCGRVSSSASRFSSSPSRSLPSWP